MAKMRQQDLIKYVLSILIVLAAGSVEQGPDNFPPSTLVHVNLLYRHGDRSPVYIYLEDKNTLDIWTDGLGWLSNIGKQQQYELGQYLHERYGGFLNVSRYDHQQITVESSGVPRCLMSAYSNLAGLFPPVGDQVWQEGMPWQPVPVTMTPAEEDNKLAISATCPRYNQLLLAAYQSEAVQQYQEDNAEFIHYVSENTGVADSLLSVLPIGDTLTCEKAHNLTWNLWAYKEGTFEKLREMMAFGWNLQFGQPEMAKLKGGPLLKEMIENMNTASQNSDSLPKVHMYSAHDSTVAALLHAMTLFNNLQPPYRSLVLVELHSISGQDYVKVFLRNDTTQEPYYLVPEGCEDPCRLSTFQTILSSTIPDDWEAECVAIKLLASQPLSTVSSVVLGVGISLAVLAIVAVIAVILVVRRNDHVVSKL